MNAFKRSIAMFATLLSAAVLLQIVPVQSALAADASQWDPGYIIADNVFFDGQSMNSGEIQTFLNGKVSSCRAGYVCLKDYAQATPNMPATSACPLAFQGGYHSAADIIYGVGIVCGINQRVLLVLLQKEQSLITDTWPTTNQYNKATGFSCPDTAPCDPAYAGFFYQVYSAASQLKTYGQNPSRWRYKAGQWNDIQYNPDADCGTQRVFIANQATANLYIYTPYVPNQAALSNLYGVGDGCSAYGNRNFWRIFTDWFGNPRSYSADARFSSFWAARGGSSGYMGPPIAYAVSVDANGGGWYQKFLYGTAYQSSNGTTTFVSNNSNYLSTYINAGGPAGAMGWPTAEWTCQTGGICAQTFQAGAITSTPAWGTHAVWGGFYTAWAAGGGLNGTLGAALNDIRGYVNARGVGYVQHFSRGVYVISVAGSFAMTKPGIVNQWYANGAETGWLSWPQGVEDCDGSACAMSFTGGIITTADGVTGYGSYGGLVYTWANSGGLRGTLGAASTPVRFSSNASGIGWAQSYQRGSQAQSAIGGGQTVTGAIDNLWRAYGSEASWMGWPTSTQSCSNDGACWQKFSGGVVVTSSAGTFAVMGGLADYWSQQGGYAKFGAPIGPISFSAANGGGWKQEFRNGTITQSLATGFSDLPAGAILSTWSYYGAENTWLGWPSGPQTCDSSNNCTQSFQHGTASFTNGSVQFAPN